MYYKSLISRYYSISLYGLLNDENQITQVILGFQIWPKENICCKVLISYFFDLSIFL